MDVGDVMAGGPQGGAGGGGKKQPEKGKGGGQEEGGQECNICLEPANEYYHHDNCAGRICQRCFITLVMNHPQQTPSCPACRSTQAFWVVD